MTTPSSCTQTSQSTKRTNRTTQATDHRTGRSLGHRLTAIGLTALACVIASVPAAANAASVAAAVVFRCNDSYSDRPCPEAQVLQDLDDRRSDSQRIAALAVASREAALADQMRRDGDAAARAASSTRSTKSLQQRRASLGSLSATHIPTATTAPTAGNTKRRNTDANDFVAYVPRAPKQATVKKSP